MSRKFPCGKFSYFRRGDVMSSSAIALLCLRDIRRGDNEGGEEECFGSTPSEYGEADRAKGDYRLPYILLSAVGRLSP